MRLQRHLIHLLCLLLFPTTAFADVEFYTYGGFRPIVNAFTNLAVIFDSEDYLVFGFVVAIIGVTVGMLVKSGLAALGKATSKDALAILFLAMFGTALFGALFEPKTTVHIYDPTHNQYESVGDIPLALAFIASGTNLLERFATDTVSDGIGFGRTRHANGKSLELMFNILGSDPVSHDIYISKSIERYFKGCVVPAAANSATFSGFDYNAVLNGTADIWTELARTRDSDQRFLWFNQANPGGIVMNCEEGYDNIRDVLLNPDTFSTYIENACIKSGYESDTPEGILDCQDLIEETAPLIFAGSVDPSPENISAMATLANGLYMTLAETPGSAITSIGNMKQMSQGYGSTIIAEGWLPSMRSATLVIILSFTPLIILMIFTPFVFRALHMLSALFLFLTIWGASDAIIHVVIVDNVMSMLAEVKTFEGGLRSFLTAPSELQKSIAMFGKMQSLGVMFAGLMTAFYFKFSSMQFANMGEKLANDIDSTGQQVGNEVINPINRMETMRQAASSAGHYNLMAKVGPELHGAAIGETAAWGDSTNANKLQKMGELGYSPQQAITMSAQNRGGEAAGAVLARHERALETGSNLRDTASDMSRSGQLTSDAKANYDLTQMSGITGSSIDRAETLANINNAETTSKLNYSKDASTHVHQSDIALNERYGSGDATWKKAGHSVEGVHQLAMENTTTNLESTAATRNSRENAVVAGYGSSHQDVANTVADVGTSSSIGTSLGWSEAIDRGIVDSGVTATKEGTLGAARASVANNRATDNVASQEGQSDLDIAKKSAQFGIEGQVAQADTRIALGELTGKSTLQVARQQHSLQQMHTTVEDAKNINNAYPGKLDEFTDGVTTFSFSPGDNAEYDFLNPQFTAGGGSTYNGQSAGFNSASTAVENGDWKQMEAMLRAADTDQEVVSLAGDLATGLPVSRSAQESEAQSTSVSGAASFWGTKTGSIPLTGPVGKVAGMVTNALKSSSKDKTSNDSTDKATDTVENLLPSLDVGFKLGGKIGADRSDSSTDTANVNPNVAALVDTIKQTREKLSSTDDEARYDALAEFQRTYLDMKNADMNHLKEMGKEYGLDARDYYQSTPSQLLDDALNKINSNGESTTVPR